MDMLLIFILFSISINNGVDAMSIPGTKPIISFCLGEAHGCAVFNTQQMKCWGNPGYAGTSSFYGDSPATVGDAIPYFDPGTSRSITRVSCSQNGVCILLDDGTMKCVGMNNYGQSGSGTTASNVGALFGQVGDTLPTVNLGNMSQVIDIGLGSAHSCALLIGNKVKCFGYNAQGQLGLGDTASRGRLSSDMGENLPFIDFGTNIEVASIHSGVRSKHSCVILSAPASAIQRVKCWGRNTYGQLGYGFVGNKGDGSGEMGDNLALVDLGAESRVIQIGTGEDHTCMILFNDILKCIGDGTYGQFGSGSSAAITSTGSSIPSIIVDAGKTVKMLSSGETHNCIVYDDMITMKCMGSNNYGQLGQGDTSQRGNSPLSTIPKIPSIDLGTGTLTIRSIHSGLYFNCAIFQDYSIKCFGDNNNAQFAIGSTSKIGDQLYEMGTNLTFSILFSPTISPTISPSLSPTPPTPAPTKVPTSVPTSSPSISPTKTPSQSPTKTPTLAPSQSPSTNPTKRPTKSPSASPTKLPTSSPARQCDYSSAKLCRYDPKCMWLKIDDINQCSIYDCSALNKAKCGKERSRCNWNKKRKVCDFKQLE